MCSTKGGSVLVAAILAIASGCQQSSSLEGLAEEPQLPAGHYRIREGDMLSGIAKREYRDGDLWYALLNANAHLKERPNFSLYAGEVISVPPYHKLDKTLPKSVFPKQLPGKYVILPGDSLYFIAERVYGDRTRWKDIYDANKEVLSVKVLTDARQLTAGQVITLPRKL